MIDIVIDQSYFILDNNQKQSPDEQEVLSDIQKRLSNLEADMRRKGSPKEDIEEYLRYELLKALPELLDDGDSDEEPEIGEDGDEVIDFGSWGSGEEEANGQNDEFEDPFANQPNQHNGESSVGNGEAEQGTGSSDQQPEIDPNSEMSEADSRNAPEGNGNQAGSADLDEVDSDTIRFQRDRNTRGFF